jgi:hypothetical protein
LTQEEIRKNKIVESHLSKRRQPASHYPGRKEGRIIIVMERKNRMPGGRMDGRMEGRKEGRKEVADHEMRGNSILLLLSTNLCQQLTPRAQLKEHSFDTYSFAKASFWQP